MMKSGAPPDKFGVMQRLLHIEFFGSYLLVLSQFLETVWVPLKSIGFENAT